MRTSKKIIIFVISLLVLILLGIWIKKIDNKNIEARFWLEDLLSFFEEEPSNITTYIQYDMLSSKYKLSISRNEYEAAETVDDKISLYRKIADVQPLFFNDVPDLQSTEDYKKGAEFILTCDDIKYRVKHIIRVRPNFITLKLEVVYWNIQIEEVQ